MTEKEPCPKCGKRTRFSVLDSYHYTDSGLDNVYLTGVETIVCDCGESVVLTAAPSLLRIIAFCFAFKPAALRGREIRFMRHVLGRKAVDFAQMLSITPEHLSRLENDAKPAGASLDKFVRARLLLAMMQDHPKMAGLFDIEAFQKLIDSELPSDDDDLLLFVKYVGPYVGDDHEPVEFEFQKAA